MLQGTTTVVSLRWCPGSKWGSGGHASCDPGWQFAPERGKLVPRTYGQSRKDFPLPARAAAFFSADAHARRGAPQGAGQDQGGAQRAEQDLAVAQRAKQDPAVAQRSAYDLAGAAQGTGQDESGAQGAGQDLAGP